MSQLANRKQHIRCWGWGPAAASILVAWLRNCLICSMKERPDCYHHVLSRASCIAAPSRRLAHPERQAGVWATCHMLLSLLCMV
jgi:hypothetical protein